MHFSSILDLIIVLLLAFFLLGSQEILRFRWVGLHKIRSKFTMNHNSQSAYTKLDLS